MLHAGLHQITCVPVLRYFALFISPNLHVYKCKHAAQKDSIVRREETRSKQTSEWNAAGKRDRSATNDLSCTPEITRNNLWRGNTCTADNCTNQRTWVRCTRAHWAVDYEFDTDMIMSCTGGWGPGTSYSHHWSWAWTPTPIVMPSTEAGVHQLLNTQTMYYTTLSALPQSTQPLTVGQ